MINNQKGFTLVEVLASMVILFIILMTFSGVFSQSALFTQATEESLQATTLVQRVVDEIRSGCTEILCISLVDDEGHFEEEQSLKLTIETSEQNPELDPELDPQLGLVLIRLTIERTDVDNETILAERYLYLPKANEGENNESTRHNPS